MPGRLEDYPQVNMLGHTWRRIEIEAKLTMSNHRPDTATLCIHPTIEGEFKESATPPDSIRTLGEPGSRFGVNPKQELVWNVELQPGESKVLTYRYTTLVWF